MVNNKQKLSVVLLAFLIGASFVIPIRFTISNIQYLNISNVSASTVGTSNTVNLTKGLAGWWTFDGTSVNAVKVLDKSGNNNNGTRAGTRSVIGKIGQAIKFNGADDYIDFPGFNLSNYSALTISAWVNFKPKGIGDSTQVADSIITQYSGGGSGLIFDDYDGEVGASYNNGLRFWVEGSSCSYGDGAIILGAWNHVSATYRKSDGSARLYVNGVNIKDCTLATDWSSGANVRIGNQTNGGGYQDANGSIDDVRVYNRALSVSEIKQLYAQGAGSKIATAPTANVSNAGLNKGLMGYWTFDGRDTGPAFTMDKSGNNNSGARTGTRSVIGKIGQAFSFDGTDDAVTFTALSNLFSSSVGSVSVWLKPTGPTPAALTFAYQGQCAIGDITGGWMGICRTNITGQGDKMWLWNYDVNEDMVGVAYNINEWIHLAWVHNGGRVYAYKNGVLVDSVASGNTGVMTGIFAIGKGASSLYFKGSIDDVRVYNRALSASEIKQLYQQGAGNKTATAPATNVSSAGINKGLVGYWTFDGKDTGPTYTMDRSGNNNTGLRTGTRSIIGKIGQGMSFDGADDYIALPTFTSLFNAPFSASTWVNFQTLSGTQMILDNNSNAGNDLFSVFRSGGSVLVNYKVGGTGLSSVDTGFAPTVKKYYHFVFVVDGVKFTLYVDGVKKYQANHGATQSSYNSDKSVEIGRRKNYYSDATENPFQGFVDDVRVYNRALSKTEIQQLYAMGK